MTDNQPNDQDPAATSGAPVETIESLKVIIVDLNDDKEVLNAQIEKLIADLGLRDKQIIVLTNEKADLEKELSDAADLLAGQKTTIDELTAQLAAVQANPSTVPTFTLAKKTYEVHASSFKYRNDSEPPREYTVQELLNDPKLQAVLVKKGVGFITLKA